MSTRSFDRKRGRHKKRLSLETKAWEAEHLPPAQPAWMDNSTYLRLVELRRQADPLAAPHHMT